MLKIYAAFTGENLYYLILEWFGLANAAARDSMVGVKALRASSYPLGVALIRSHTSFADLVAHFSATALASTALLVLYSS